MRTRFICSINNEAVLKALFKVKDDQLTFGKAVEVAIEIEDAAKVAKETVHGQNSTHEINKVQLKKKAQFSPAKVQYSTGECIRCGRRAHIPNDCRFKNSTCNYCDKIGDLEIACLKKKKDSKNLKYDQKKAKKVLQLPVISIKVLELQLPIKLNGKITANFEIDTGAGESFIGKNTWHEIGKPTLEEPTYKVC